MPFGLGTVTFVLMRTENKIEDTPAGPGFQARFWAKVEKTKTCWLWTACKDNYGYGVFRNCRYGSSKAHRLAYIWIVGPIPDGLQIDHLCRVRHCVNPAHLEPVTARENQLRGDTLAARNSRKTHCPYGHLLDAINCQGKRFCRKCSRAADKRWYRRNKRKLKQDS